MAVQGPDVIGSAMCLPKGLTLSGAWRYRVSTVATQAPDVIGSAMCLPKGLTLSGAWRYRVSSVATQAPDVLGSALGPVSVSVSAQGGIVALGKAHTRSARLSAVSPRLPSKQCQYLSGWTQIVLGLAGWNVGRFLSPLLFPSGDQCRDILACPWDWLGPCDWVSDHLSEQIRRLDARACC